VILPADIRRDIEAHARACFPHEACGLVAADSVGDLRSAYCTTNVDHSSHRFTVAPDEHYAAIGDAESRGLHVAGSFHSHPTSQPVPSRSDIARALDPDWLYLIVGPVGTGGLDMRCYRIVNGVATEVPLTTGVEA
jgi:proteasome lid subunit RPN8/RPN11